MGGNTQDWANLANTIRGTSQDYYNTALGVAKYMDESRINDLRYKNEMLRYKELDAADKAGDLPVNMSSLVGEAIGSEPMSAKVEYSKGIDKTLSSFGFKIDPETHNIVGSDNKPITRRMFKNIANDFVGSVYALADPQVLAEAELEKLVAARDAVANDPAKVQALDKQIAQVKSQVGNFGTPSEWVLNMRKNALIGFKNRLGALGADTKIFDDEVRDINTKLDKVFGVELEKRNWIQLPDSIATALNIPKGTSFPKDIVQSAIPAYLNLKGHLATVGAQTAAAKAQKESMNFNTFITAYEAAADKAATALLNGMKNEMGEVVITDETGKSRKATPTDIEKIYAAGRQTGGQNFLQQMKSAGMEFPKLGQKLGVTGFVEPGQSVTSTVPVAGIPQEDMKIIKSKMTDLKGVFGTLPKADQSTIATQVDALNNKIKTGKVTVTEVNKTLDMLLNKYKNKPRTPVGISKIKNANTASVDEYINSSLNASPF